MYVVPDRRQKDAVPMARDANAAHKTLARHMRDDGLDNLWKVECVNHCVLKENLGRKVVEEGDS